MSLSPLWIDNRTALVCAQTAGNDLTDIKAKSRHFVLRFLNVKDEAHRLAFAPTDKMLADGLTKFTTANAIQMLQATSRILLFQLREFNSSSP